MDAGSDSLGAVELRNSMSQLTGSELPGTLVLDHPPCPWYLSSRMLAAWLRASEFTLTVHDALL
jgi:hypothetical protein